MGRHTLTAGLEGHIERLSADRLAKTGERNRQSIFLQDQFSLLPDDALTLVPGLRYDRDSQFGSQISPKLALRYDLSKRLLLRVGAGLGYRAPDFKQLSLQFSNPAVGYVVEGNPDLQPERSTGFNLGMYWRGSSDLELGANAYHHRVRELIDIVQTAGGNPSPGNPARFTYTNVSRARISGVDLYSKWRSEHPQLRSLHLQLGYGLLFSKDADTDAELSGRARHRANVDLSWRKPGYELGLRGAWTGIRQFQTELDTGGAPTGAGKAGAYALFDTRAQWKGWSVADLSLGISNLFNAGDPRFLPIAPRAFFLEIHKDFEGL
jgi:outer membrane receptor for ferrienterochelin and colicins